MTKGVADTLKRVALVSQGWADDAVLPSALRHMSLHLNGLTTGLLRNKHFHPAAIKDVGSLCCLICQRIKVESGECERLLAHCSMLKNITLPSP